MDNVTVQIQMLPGCEDLVPSKAHPTDAGLDLKIAQDITLYPGTMYKLPVGFKLAIPEGWYGAVVPRSGLSLKGFRVINAPGTLDSAYRGEVMVLATADKSYIDFHRGERIAQLLLLPVPKVTLEVVQELDQTTRGAGGFGSTGA